MSERSYVCPFCHSRVTVPHRLRTVTVEDVRRVHEETCPGVFRVKRDREREARTPSG